MSNELIELANGDGWRTYSIDGEVWLELKRPHYWTSSPHGTLVVLKPDVIEGIKNMEVPHDDSM